MFCVRPCEECGEPVKDRNDPKFKGRWLCYHCHCVTTGKDPKKALNLLVEALHTGRLVYVEQDRHVSKPPAKPG